MAGRALLLKLTLIVAVSTAVLGPTDASAQQAVNLGIKPVGQQGNYFDTSLAAGESRNLTAEL